MLVAWMVGVQVLAAAGDVGSVDGPQAFVETRAVVDDRLEDSFGSPDGLTPPPRSGVVLAAQARAAIGWRVRCGAHRLVFGVNWKPSVLLHDELASLPMMVATPGLLEPAASAVLVTPLGVSRLRLSLPLSSYSAVRLGLHVRRDVSQSVRLGLEVDGFVSLAPLPVIWPSVRSVRCAFPERRCTMVTRTHWSGELAALAEWRFRDDWSLAGRLSVAHRSEGIPLVFPELIRTQWLVSEASFDSVVTWSPTRFVGVSASFAVTGAARTDGYFDSSATVGLSLWLRTDARLQRNWIDL